MFPLNGAFYIPVFYYTPQPYLVSNPSFLCHDLNIFTKTETYFDSATSLSVMTQIERKENKGNQTNELYLPVKNEQKSKDFMKRKMIRKKYEKCVDSVEQAERLKRKLANRPKTYQTEKKMYLNANLEELGANDEGRRTLRRRPDQPKKEKVLQQVSSKCDVEESPVNRDQPKIFQIEEKQISLIRQYQNSNRNQNFYNPSANIPKPFAESPELLTEIEHKRLSLIVRKMEANANCSQ